jgi:SAM-dependent methyltransferase
MTEPTTGNASADASTGAMREFWDQRARENAMWFIDSRLDYRNTDEQAFWDSGERDLDTTLGLVDANVQGHERILEIGCGIGRLTRALAARTRSVVGIDVSAEMVDRARAALSGVDNVEIRLGNGTDLADCPDASFDACYSFVVFQHIPDPAVTCAYVVEMGRILVPGGWTVFQVSDMPELHERRRWSGTHGWRDRLARLAGRRPHGCLDPQWLGSAVPSGQLDDALERGSLQVVASYGAGTQYHLVHARRR